MKYPKGALKYGSSAWSGGSPRRPRRAELAWDCLEERTVLSHVGGAGLQQALHRAHAHHSSIGSGTSTTTGTTTTTTGSTQLQTDQQALNAAIQALRKTSGTTVGELATLRSDFQALRQAGLVPASSAIEQFKTDLLTAVAAANTAGTALTTDQLSSLRAEFTNAFGTSATSSTSNAALISQAFTDLVTAAKATGYTTAQVATISTDLAKVQADLAALSSGTTSTGGHGACVGGGGVSPTTTTADLLLPGYY
jgi:hypothetical protein